jgi:hypothetical protein
MARCETCGTEYEPALQITLRGKTHYFDCFQCAIQTLAPSCGRCGCQIIGHGHEVDGIYYCCKHCATHPEEVPMVLAGGAD